MREIEVLYKLGEDGTLPTQGYENDFAYDMYAAEGVLVPPSAYKSTMIKTDLRTAFDPIEAGMMVAIRSGVAAKTPLIVSNSPGIIEGTYRNGIGILVRNTFIDNSLVDFVFDVQGNRIPLNQVPSPVKKKARKIYDEELDLLGYDKTKKQYQPLFKKSVPRGTIYIPKGTRIAQMFFAPKYVAKFKEVEELPESDRGLGGFGSSGVEKK